MKYQIDIEGLPEGYDVESVKITHNNVMDGGIMLAVVNVKKKQPRRIVLEEVEERNSFIKIDGIPYRIVEDSGDKNDD